jgi:HK97 family phage prohead protease
VKGNVDLGGDLIDDGAFTKTLLEKKEFPLTWLHDVRDILGVSRVDEDSIGLKTHGVFNMAVQSAREKYALLKQGAIKSLSFGYKAVKVMWEKDVRRLKEIKLFEIALVPFGMNPLATISAVKSHDLTLGDSLSMLLALPADIKSGRVISSANLKLIQQAAQALRALLDAAQPSDDTGKGGKPPDIAGKPGIHSLADLHAEILSLKGSYQGGN